MYQNLNQAHPHTGRIIDPGLPEDYKTASS